MTWSVESPSGEVALALDLSDAGAPSYAVRRRGQPVVGGGLGLVLDAADLTSGLVHRAARHDRITSSFTLPHGKARSVRADANELTLTFESGAGRTLVVIARAYDDGVAFRYVLPGDPHRLASEATVFEFAADGKAWIQPTDEQYAFDERFPDDAPWLNTILPFTRNVVGSMDYTPVTFSDVEYPHRTTNAHELALAVVFESALAPVA